MLEDFIIWIESQNKTRHVQRGAVCSSMVANGLIISNALKHKIIPNSNYVSVIYCMLMADDLLKEESERADFTYFLFNAFELEEAEAEELSKIIKECFRCYNEKHLFKNQLN